MYANQIDKARKLVAILVGLFGFGFAVSMNLRFGFGGLVCGSVVAICLVATFCLAVEYLVRTWMETRQNRIAAYQITLLGMLTATAIVGLILAVFRVIGVGVVPVSIMVIVLLACGVESLRRCRSKSTRQATDVETDK